MSFDPISLIASLVVGAASRNMKQSAQGANESQRYAMQQKQPGMQMGSAPQLQNNAESPTAQLTQLATGTTPQMQYQVPGVGQALQGEKAQLQPAQSAVGGWAVQPMNGQDEDMNAYAKYLQNYGRGF